MWKQFSNIVLLMLQIANFKKLALIATNILGKTSAETVTDPKQYLPLFFKNGQEVKSMTMLLQFCMICTGYP